MTRRTNLINNILSLIINVGLLITVVLVCNARYSANIGSVVLFLLIGAIVSGLVVTFAHELGHLFSGKKNGFAFISMTVWFFNWKRVNDKVAFSFCMLKESAGFTEMVAKDRENLKARVRKMTKTASVFTFFAMIIGIVPLFLTAYIPLWAYSLWAMFLPIGAYTFFGNILPMRMDGISNDGALLRSLRKDDDESKVILALIGIQSELYNGKTPSSVDKSLYFDLPQLQEDNFNFMNLLTARYAYYLDAEDFANAKKTNDRLLTLTKYMPKTFANMVKVDCLYDSCTFDKNITLADELTYELEKFLNNVNSSENVRAKIAYNLYVKGEKDGLDTFYNKGIKEANKNPLKGVSLYEKKLLLKMKDDILAD